ncbi:MAG: AAA family ATPase [Spirosomataceae bacterium]
MNPGDKKYKFKEIKAYATTESFIGATRNYKRVFEESKTAYIYCELTFYNKLFDEEDWTAKVTHKAYKVRSDNTREAELCKLDETIKVTKDLNIVYARNSWGMDKPGAFWKRGDYDWETFIDDELVGTLRFHVESGGEVTSVSNPYFDVESIKFYEGGYDGVSKDLRHYVTQFKGKETKYLYAELNLINKQAQAWFCEVFFNIYNDAGQQKCQMVEKVLVNNQSQVTITSGWGHDNPGTWFNDKYRMEVVFMDTLVGVVPFSVDEEWVEGTSQMLASDGVFAQQMPPAKTDAIQEKNIEELLQELDTMIGLNEVKQKLRDFTDYVKFMQYRAEQGIEEPTKINIHTVFTGNPGTGKTTVAQMLGKIYKALGLLSKGHVLEVGRADLVAEFIGQTAPKVKALLEKARGGVLFIDEAYALARSKEDGKDFGLEVIEVLIKEMSDGKGDLAVVVAGYPDPMNTFLEANPGLRSRFNLFFHFADYLPQELLQILDYKATQKNVAFTDEARHFLYGRITEAYRTRDESFGNARLIAGWVDEAKMNLGLRLMRSGKDLKQLGADALKTIELADVKTIFKTSTSSLPDIQIDEPLLQLAMDDLNHLIGLGLVKSEVMELVKLVRFYRESGKDVLGKFSLHTVFSGNPGTGKTTVARIFAQILKGLGILERGHLIETDRQGLVAGYIGQTATKTQQVINKALGGVLFIDEAYALSQGGENDFGQEAVETLLKQMEDRRGQFVVVVAGYTDKMKKFLEMNPGLSSRFDREMTFEDYSPVELFEIALSMLRNDGITPDAEAASHLRSYLESLHGSKDRFFGNGRAVRKIISEAINNQNLRLAEIPKHERTQTMLQTLTLADVQEFKIDDAPSSQTGIGFRIGGK